jgi:hypothetical protein
MKPAADSDCDKVVQHEEVEMPDSDQLKLFTEAAEDEEQTANAPKKQEKKSDGAPVDEKLKANADEITLKLLEEHANESAVEKALDKDEDDKDCPESSPLEDDSFLQLGS